MSKIPKYPTGTVVDQLTVVGQVDNGKVRAFEQHIKVRCACGYKQEMKASSLRKRELPWLTRQAAAVECRKCGKRRAAEEASKRPAVGANLDALLDGMLEIERLANCATWKECD